MSDLGFHVAQFYGGPLDGQQRIVHEGNAYQTTIGGITYRYEQTTPTRWEYRP